MRAFLRRCDPATALEVIGAGCLITAGALVHGALAFLVAGVVCFAGVYAIEGERRRGRGDEQPRGRHDAAA